MKSKLLLILTIMLTNCTADSSTISENISNPVAILPADTLHLPKVNAAMKGMYPVIISHDLQSTRQFFTAWFNFEVVFESSWFILLASPGEGSSMIAFMSEEHPSTPPSPRATKGEGMFLTLDVSNASELYTALQNSGAAITYKLTDEQWGQRRFALTDPNGIWIDVVEQIQPEQGWWDKYITK